VQAVGQIGDAGITFPLNELLDSFQVIFRGLGTVCRRFPGLSSRAHPNLLTKDVWNGECFRRGASRIPSKERCGARPGGSVSAKQSQFFDGRSCLVRRFLQDDLPPTSRAGLDVFRAIIQIQNFGAAAPGFFFDHFIKSGLGLH
jgi:hypothetical protein